MPGHEIQHCIRCGRGLKAPGGITITGDRAIAVYVNCVTVGFRPRKRSALRRNVFCVPCGISVAFGPRPESGAFNSDIYEMLRDIVSQGPAITVAAYEQLVDPNARPRLMPGSTPDATLETPMLKRPALEAS